MRRNPEQSFGSKRSMPVSVLLLSAAAALGACDERERAGFGPPGSNSSAGLVFGVVRFARDGSPVPGALVRTVITQGTCDGGVLARGPETTTDQVGSYRLEVVLDREPFLGCVSLEVDFDRDTIRPDLTIPGAVMRFQGRWSLRLDVAVAAGA